jgi:multiple sugar transport system permease protein
MADQAPAPAQRPPGILRRLGRSEHLTGWTLVGPGAILIGIFGLLPVLMSLKLSFQRSDLLTPETPWVGTEN